MDYKKKSLSKLKNYESYEEIDTRLASGWYVDALSGNNKKKYKTKEVVFKISKKSEQAKFFIFKTTKNLSKTYLKYTYKIIRKKIQTNLNFLTQEKYYCIGRQTVT